MLQKALAAVTFSPGIRPGGLALLILDGMIIHAVEPFRQRVPLW